MTTIRPADLRAMVQRLSQDGALDRADVDSLIDAAMTDKTLSLGERAELQAVLAQHADRIDSPETRKRLEGFLGMTDGRLRTLAHDLEKDDGVLDSRDAAKLFEAVQRDGKVSHGERFSLLSMMIGSKLHDDARASLQALADQGAAAPAPIERTSTPALAIPDNDAAGVQDAIHVSAPGRVASVAVELDLEHTYRGDLSVSLVGPDGTEVMLHKKGGGGQDDLIGTYGVDLDSAESLDRFTGKPLTGDWTLKVVDSAGRDTGTLHAWKLSLTPEAAAPPPPAGDVASGRSAPELAIPDNRPAGVQDGIRLSGGGQVASVEVELDIEHSYRGDLQVSLVHPDGTEVMLHDRAGGGADHLKGRYPSTLVPKQSLDLLKGKAVDGEWALRVRDLAGQDVGTLKSWSLAVARQGDTPPPAGEAKKLGDTAAARPVYLSSQGFFVEDKDVAAPRSNPELASGLFRMAELVDDARTNPLKDGNLPVASREKVLQNIKDTLAKVPPGGAAPTGLDATQALQLRSSSVTVLLALCESAGTSGGELALKQAAFAAYKGAVEAETNPVLRDSMIFNLHAVKASLTTEMKAVSDTFMNELAPLSPPYEDWFKDGNRTLNIAWKCGQGTDGFYRGTVAMLKQKGFAAEGAEREGGPATYVKTMRDRHGEEYTVRLTIGENRDNIFDAMDDPKVHIVGYDGHSDIGRAVPASLRRAPAGHGKKLVFYGLCAGKDNLHRVRDKYPDAQILTTFTSSYFNTKDVNGQKQMSRSENFNTLMTLIDDAVERRPWAEINRDIRDNAILFPWSHVMPGGTNYISPVHTMIRRRVLDTDHDGQADILDKLVSFDTTRVAEDTRREFTPLDPGRPAKALDGTAVHLAAMALNTATGYNEVTQDYKKGNIVGDGYFEPRAGDTAIVRFVRDIVDGEPALRMQVNKKYAHMSPEALRAVAQYQFIRDIEGEGRLAHLPVEDKKLMALTFAAFSIIYDEQYYSRDTAIWNGLKQALHLPDGLDFRTIQGLLGEEHHDYSGNLGHVKKWKESLPADVIEALKRDDSGIV